MPFHPASLLLVFYRGFTFLRWLVCSHSQRVSFACSSGLAPLCRALHHVDFDELQVNFELSEKHRVELKEVKLPILLNLCQSLVRMGHANGDSSHLVQAKERATDAIELDAKVRKLPPFLSRYSSSSTTVKLMYIYVYMYVFMYYVFMYI